MAPSGQDVVMHTISRTPEYEDFINRLREYHLKRGTPFDPEPRVGAMHLDLLKVFNHIIANGGYDKVSEEKLAWRRMASELGIYSNNEASTAFSLKEKFYKNLAAFEISTIHGKEPPPRDILEDVTAKGASLLTRTRENFRGKRESNIGGASAPDSVASGDDGTPVRDKPVLDAAASARASRGLREAPPQRVIFQPDTGPTRTRTAAAHHAANSPGMNHGTPTPHGHAGMPPAIQHHGHHAAPVQRGPSVQHNPPNDNTSYQVTAYQPRMMKPLPLRAVPTPSNAPAEFSQKARQQRQLAAARKPMVPGTGFDGPNIYTRCLNALRSSIVAEQTFALNHLVKISFERGDKYRFDSFPGLAEGLVEKVLQVGSLFYHVNWRVSWTGIDDPSDIGLLDGDNGTPDILERIDGLIEKDTPDVLQTEKYADELVLITEAALTIRNMMTLAENAAGMADFPLLQDMLCIMLRLPARDSLTELKHLALDTAEQLTPYLVLNSEDALYKTLLQQMTSDDRGTILAALRALGRISINLDAANRLGDVPQPVLERVVSWLLLNDDELTDACLDFLYQYTAVVPNVDALVRSGVPHGLVEHLVRLLSHGARKAKQELLLMPERKMPARGEIAPMPEDLLQEMLKLEEPDRVYRWVKCFFEEDGDSFVTQLAAWQAYQSAFVGPLKAMGQALITPADFIRSSTSVYKDSNAQVLREPGEPQQKFIIHGLRPRPRPLSLDGREYGRCLWASNPARRREKCGQFFLQAEQMWAHIMESHLGQKRNDEGKLDNVELECRCTWAECHKYEVPTRLHLDDFSRHVSTHISAMIPADHHHSGAADSDDSESESGPPAGAWNKRSWVLPAVTMSVTTEETLTVRDERNPNLPPQAAGIPLSAALILRNIARNVVKTEAEEELTKAQKSAAAAAATGAADTGMDVDVDADAEQGGWNERLFRPLMPRLFEILTENKALAPYMASLLELIRIDDGNDESD